MHRKIPRKNNLVNVPVCEKAHQGGRRVDLPNCDKMNLKYL